jgi:hypothetical protein
MDLTKLLSLLEDQALHYARVDQLSDPFEGSVPKSMLETPSTVRNAAGDIEPADAQFKEMFRRIRPPAQRVSPVI